jgi:hypothetical protein
MGYELYRMIRDGHPHTWTSAMVLVALVIADDARDPGQGAPEDGGWSAIPMCGCWRGGEWRDGITERTGMSKRGISRALTRLSRAGYEMREPIGTGRDGRPFFATPGRVPHYRVPQLLPRPAPERPRGTAGERSPSTATFAGERSPSTTSSAAERPAGKAAEAPAGQARRAPDLARKGARFGTQAAEYGDPVITPAPNIPPALNRSAVNSSLEGTQGAARKPIGQDQDFSGGSERPRSASRARAAPPDLAYKIVRRFLREQGGDHALGAQLHAPVAAMLADGTDKGSIEAGLVAWHGSGKPPEALPEFVEPSP